LQQIARKGDTEKKEMEQKKDKEKKKKNICFDVLLYFAFLIIYIYVPEDKMKIPKVVGYLVYVAFYPGVFFAHSMNQVLVYVFYSQFKKLKKNFRRVLGKDGQFTGDLSLFRRRHQTISRAISKLDGFMKISNVAGFVFHIVGIILVLYSFIFYPEFTSGLTYLKTASDATNTLQPHLSKVSKCEQCCGNIRNYYVI